MVQVLVIGGVVLSCILNTICSKMGHSLKSTQKDILVPLCLFLFLFYPMLIYIPEAHRQLQTLSTPQDNGKNKDDTDESFPFAFLIVLFTITVCIVMHQLVGKKCWRSKQDAAGELQGLNSRQQGGVKVGEAKKDAEKEIEMEIGTDRIMGSQTNVSNRRSNTHSQSQAMSYLLSTAISLQYIPQLDSITSRSPQTQPYSLIKFTLFSCLLTFSYGYTCHKIPTIIHNLQLIPINLGILLGLLLGICLPGGGAFLPCLRCLSGGLMIYVGAVLGLSAVFNKGEAEGEGEGEDRDRWRFVGVVVGFLVTLLYFPVGVLLHG